MGRETPEKESCSVYAGEHASSPDISIENAENNVLV